MCVCKRPKLIPSDFCCSPHSFLRQGLSLDVEPTGCLDYLARKPQGFSCLSSLLVVYSRVPHTWLFMWVGRLWTHVLMVGQQALCWLSPAPIYLPLLPAAVAVLQIDRWDGSDRRRFWTMTLMLFILQVWLCCCWSIKLCSASSPSHGHPCSLDHHR